MKRNNLKNYSQIFQDVININLQSIKALSRSRIESAKSVKSIKSVKSVQSLKAVKVRQQEIKLENKRLKQKIEKAQPAFPFIKSQKEFKKHLDEKIKLQGTLRQINKNQDNIQIKNKQTNDKLPILRQISQNSVRGAGEPSKLRIGFPTESQFKH